MKSVIKELKEFKLKIFFSIIAVTMFALTMLFIPTLMRILIDEAIPNGDTGQVWVVSGFMLVAVVVGLVGGIWSSRLSAEIASGVGRNMRSKVFAKVQELSQEEVDHFSISSLITRTNNDITQVQNFLNQCLKIAMLAPVLCIFGIIFSLKESAKMSMILIFAIPIMVITLALIGKIVIPLSTLIQTRLDKINLIIREKLTGIRVIRAFGTDKFEANRFDEVNKDYMRISKRLQRWSNYLLPVLTIILSFTAAGVMLLGYHLYTKGEQGLSTGLVMAVVEYVMLIMMATTMMTQVFLMLPRAATCSYRANQILTSVSKIKDPEEPKTVTDGKSGYLKFENVSFTYAGANRPAIRNLSFEAKPGETTAIIGGTGMGKSTIVNLIPRLYDVSEGNIYIDDINVKDYTLEELRAKIGFVPQKASLFRGTIESNIAFGDKNASEERIETAVKIAQSYDFVMKKEEGFDAPIAQGGSNLSGGQRQRLCIARAIVRKPEVYVFDDSFSALDFKTDKALRTALKEETENATTVIVAQRVSTIIDADRIIVVENGDIMGIGTHHELLKNCAIYREIVESQMGKEEMEK